MIRVIYWSDRGEKTMGQELTKADYAKENKNFWWNYLLLIRGFDEKKKMNFAKSGTTFLGFTLVTTTSSKFIFFFSSKPRINNK